MTSRILTVCAFILWGYFLRAQDFSWWNQKHQWDGTTQWSDYLIVSPGFMGPNALPVPEVRKGILPGGSYLELALDAHYSKGDQTGNLFTELFFPLFSERAALGISYVPVEIYKTDTVTRDLRRSREYDSRGVSFGDVYFNTFIHLVRETKNMPDVLLSVNLKTASGTRFEAARHTDSPGYFFDASAGKTLYTGGGRLNNIRGYAMLGFYVYQTNLENHMQNDAFLFGTGFDFHFEKLHIDNQLGGYAGYLNNGDKPLVYRLNLSWTGGSRMDIKLRFQQGFLDFSCTSVRISTLTHF